MDIFARYILVLLSKKERMVLKRREETFCSPLFAYIQFLYL